MATLSENNFEKLKVTFQKETGLDAKTNMTTYIAYFHAKVADYQMQISNFILNTLANRK